MAYGYGSHGSHGGGFGGHHRMHHRGGLLHMLLWGLLYASMAKKREKQRRREQKRARRRAQRAQRHAYAPAPPQHWGAMAAPRYERRQSPPMAARSAKQRQSQVNQWKRADLADAAQLKKLASATWGPIQRSAEQYWAWMGEQPTYQPPSYPLGQTTPTATPTIPLQGGRGQQPAQPTQPARTWEQDRAEQLARQQAEQQQQAAALALQQQRTQLEQDLSGMGYPKAQVREIAQGRPPQAGESRETALFEALRWRGSHIV